MKFSSMTVSRTTLWKGCILSLILGFASSHALSGGGPSHLWPPKEPPAMVVNAASPLFLTADDAKIFRCLQIAFARHRHLRVQDLSLTVRQGIVTLQGTVDSYKRKSFASDVVLRIDGVQGVINQLEVSEEQQLPDEEIARRLRQRLHTIPFFPADQITVSVSEGVVTLSGMVDQLQRVYQVEDEAFWTEGVRDIVNHLTFRTVEVDPWNQGVADQ